MAEETTNGQTTTIGAGNVEGLLAFLDYLVEKGYATQSAVHPLKAATRAVFSRMEGERFVEFDVRTFDPDEYLDRFQNRVVGDYKQESLASYRQRVKRAVAAYRDYLATGNVSAIGSRASRRTRRETPSPATSSKANGNGEVHAPDVTGSLIDYPFPLRSGQVAHLRLPMKLDKADADRLSTFLRSLVFDPQLELSAGAEQAA
jgi:hypothetical protein